MSDPGPPPGQLNWADEMNRAAASSSPSAGSTGGAAGVGTEGRVGKSYAALLSSNLPSTWNKNVLEIVLEKDVRGAFNVSEEDCAKLMRKIGLDTRPGVHVETRECPDLSQWQRCVADHIEEGGAHCYVLSS